MRLDLKRAFTKDIGLKILAVIFAFFLWLIVVNIDDPPQTRTFTAVVTVQNEDVLTKAGKLYEIKDGINTVSFRVTAKRSIMEKLSPSDFSAVADMNYLESESRVPVTVTAKTYSSYVTISSKQTYLYVILENQSSGRFVITPEYTGTLSPEMDVNEVKCSPTVITVSGPEKLVSKIASVKAIANITNASADFTENVIPKLFDKDGNELETSGLNLSINSVNVSVDFVGIKSADIVVKTSGELPAGLTLGEITTNPSSVMIMGETAALNDVTSITIPESVINLSNITGSVATTVDIAAYLPEGVVLQEGTSSKVTIFVKMQDQEISEIEVPASNITFENLADGLEATMDEQSIKVYVSGPQSALATLTADQIKGTIDCSGLAAGEKQNVVVILDNLEEVTVQNKSATITIKEGAKDNSSDSSGENGQEAEDDTAENTEE
ncbi:MAG: hypothetical protein K5773_06340 [Pseudobutyrivibrio sp.]|nr:hypothetical protein [Pseudobutyrivibrio sp.]